MIMHDRNPEQKRIMLVIHPMLSSAEGMDVCLLHYLGNGFRYLVPDLAGHGDAMTQTYHNAAEEAEQIHDYMIANGCTDIQLAFCASLGGCVLMELLKYSDINYHHLFFEGISAYRNGWYLNLPIRWVYLFLHRYAVKHTDKLAKMMARSFGETAGKAMAERYKGINKESICNIVHDCSFMTLTELDEETRKKCVFAYGEKEFDLENSKKVLPKLYPGSRFMIWKNRGHCERMTRDSANYARMIRVYL